MVDRMDIIAKIHTDFPEKFGIPRQPGIVSELKGRIVFEPEYRNPDMIRGLEEFSHIWLIWQFSKNLDEQGNARWSPTVRPPRLGGNTRMGVFATRSPFRPNPLGLSVVAIDRIETDTPEGPVIYVKGADMVDGTPIYDIKPYLSFSDSHPDARNGFAEETKDRTLEVVFYPGIDQVLTRCCPRDTLVQEISYILAQDPRPAYQDDPEREYKMDYAGYRITFTVKDATVDVKKIEKM